MYVSNKPKCNVLLRSVLIIVAYLSETILHLVEIVTIYAFNLNFWIQTCI